MFGRDADSAGLAFYVESLASGSSDLTNIAKQIVDGIPESSVDDVIFSNKVEHAFCMTQEPVLDIEQQVEILSNVMFDLPDCLAQIASSEPLNRAAPEPIILLGHVGLVEVSGVDFL